MAADDVVALTDLRVVQEWSLAVRAATAPREELVRALEEDLAWLTGGARPRPARPAAKTPSRTPAKSPAKATKARTKASAGARAEVAAKDARTPRARKA